MSVSIYAKLEEKACAILQACYCQRKEKTINSSVEIAWYTKITTSVVISYYNTQRRNTIYNTRQQKEVKLGSHVIAGT